jgi:hypothetical protein
MSDPNAIDLQTWEDVQRAIEVALSMDGAKVEVNSAAFLLDDHGVALDVVLPSGRNVHIQVTDRPERCMGCSITPREHSRGDCYAEVS